VFLAEDGQYDVGGAHLSLRHAVATIELLLEQSPITPFFGSEPDYELPILGRLFADQGSALRPKLVRKEQWSDVAVESGDRQCLLSLRSITCIEDGRRLHIACDTGDDVVRLAIQYLEELVSFEELEVSRPADAARRVRGSGCNPDRS